MVAGIALQNAFRGGDHAVAVALEFAEQSQVDVDDQAKRIEASGRLSLYENLLLSVGRAGRF